MTAAGMRLVAEDASLKYLFVEWGGAGSGE